MNIFSPSLTAVTTGLLVTSLGLSCVQAAPPQAGQKPAPPFRDIRLADAGTLNLTVVSSGGNAMSGQIVSILHRNREIARSMTSSQGRVVIKGLRPGLHTLRVTGQDMPCRLWTAQTAPPTALRNPAFVASGAAVRGQYGPMPGPFGPGLAPAALATGVTAAAVAAIIIGKNSGDDSVFVAPASP